MSTEEEKIELIKKHIGTYPDFPKKGIIFRDVFTALLEPHVFAALNDVMLSKANGVKPDYIVGLEARGFIFGPLLALHLKLPFVPIRKKGKLPGEIISASYSLEYGKGTIEIQKNSIKPKSRVLIVDDLLATGGTLRAACNLLNEVGVKSEDLNCLVVIELLELKGRSQMVGQVANTISLIEY